MRTELFLNFLKEYVPLSLWKLLDTHPRQQDSQEGSDGAPSSLLA